MKKIILAISLLLTSFITNANAQITHEPTAKLSIIPQAETATIGKNFEIAIEMQMLGDFHTYWNENTGDTGISTAIKITPTQPAIETNQDWPAPHKQVVEPFVNFGYNDKFYVFSNIFIPNDYKEKTLAIKVNTSWLACNENSCIPDSNEQTVNIPLVFAEDAVKSEEWLKIERNKRFIPINFAEKAEFNIKADEIIIKLPDSINLDTDDFFFFPERSNLIINSDKQLRHHNKYISITRDTSLDNDIASIQELSGVINIKKDGKILSLDITASHNSSLTIPEDDHASLFSINFITIIFFALIGGIILNLMPCVLPILSIKILSLKSASKKQAYTGAISYLSGVVASFIMFASIIEILKQGGSIVGWGFQLQHSSFVIAMIYLFFILGLNLSGYFEFSSIIGSKIQSKEYKNSSLASFMSGVLAVAIASPCTAPFMGVALGYTITKGALTTYAVFIALAIGFALPFTILSIKNNWLKFLPKSGKWSAKIKEFMAFPIYATVIWLIWVLMQQTSISATTVTIANLLFISLAIWLYKNLRKRYSLFILLLTIISLIYSAVLAQDNKPMKYIQKQDSTIQMLEQEIEKGQPVFISVSASWCITCLVNEKVVLNTYEFKALMDSNNITFFKIDWTNKDDEVTKLLNKYGRNSVPTYIYYPANSDKYKILPPIITINTVRDFINNTK